MKLFCIPCSFQIDEDGPVHHGMAICSDPDTPMTFIYPNGLPYTGEEIWNYSLWHSRPWSVIENNR